MPYFKYNIIDDYSSSDESISKKDPIIQELDLCSP